MGGPYGPADLRGMAKDFVENYERNEEKNDNRGYNEVVVDSARWQSQLPSTFDAFYYPATDGCARRAGCELKARRAHREFARSYPGSDVPLLALDPMDWEAPFAAAAARGAEWEASREEG